MAVQSGGTMPGTMGAGARRKQALMYQGGELLQQDGAARRNLDGVRRYRRGSRRDRKEQRHSLSVEVGKTVASIGLRLRGGMGAVSTPFYAVSSASSSSRMAE